MDALMEHGLWAWKAVADAVRTKSRVRCEAHYWEVYLSRPTAPLPDGSVLLDREVVRGPEGEEVAEVADHRGYMARRGDFDVEYSNEAERALADLEITDTDTEEEVQLKVRLLEIYNARLDRREAAKAFVKAHGMIDALPTAPASALPPRPDHSEQQLRRRLRALARLGTLQEHQQLEEALLKEHRLVCSIKQLLQGGSDCIDRMDVDTRRIQPAVAVNHLPKAELLTEGERHICSILRITPERYLRVRQAAVALVPNRGPLAQTSPLILNVDLTQKTNSHDFSITLSKCARTKR